MKRFLIFSFVAALAVVPAVQAQLVLSDFSDIEGDGAVFLDSWNEDTTAQFTQNAGTISVTPQGAGNPQGDGYFIAGVSLDLSAYTEVTVTAREDAGNAVSVFSVVFFSDDGIGGVGPEQVFTFTAGDFAGSLTTQSISLSAPSYTDPLFDPADVRYWAIEGNYGQPGNDFRFEFDNLQLTPVPEPGTVALLGLGAGLLCWSRFRRKA